MKNFKDHMLNRVVKSQEKTEAKQKIIGEIWDRIHDMPTKENPIFAMLMDHMAYSELLRGGSIDLDSITIDVMDD